MKACPPGVRTARLTSIALAVVMLCLTSGLIAWGRTRGAEPTGTIVRATHTGVGEAIGINARPRDQLRGGSLHTTASLTRSLNPFAEASVAPPLRIVQAYLPRLFNIDAAGTAQPNRDFLTDVTVTSTSPTVVRYRLNPAARWGDGVPITAADLIATWRACSAPANRCAYAEHHLAITEIRQGATATEAIVSYARAFPDWRYTFAVPGFARAVSVATEEAFGSGWTRPNPAWYAGAYVVRGFTPEQKLTLTPNERWWGARPLVSEIVIDSSAGALADAEAVVAGRLTVAETGTDEGAAALGRSRGLVRTAPGPVLRQLTFNTMQSPLNDPVVRRALALGIDRASLRELANPAGAPTLLNNRFLLTNEAGYQDNSQGISYAPERARRLLDDAGWRVGTDGTRTKGGRALEVALDLPTDARSLVAEHQLVAQQLAGLQIRVTKRSMKLADHYAAVGEGRFDLTMMNWVSSYPTPTEAGAQYRSGASFNHAGLSDPGVDDLLTKAEAEMDPVARAALFNRADRLLWDRLPTLPLFQRPEVVIAEPRLANYGAFGLSTTQWADVGFVA